VVVELAVVGLDGLVLGRQLGLFLLLGGQGLFLAQRRGLLGVQGLGDGAAVDSEAGVVREHVASLEVAVEAQRVGVVDEGQGSVEVGGAVSGLALLGDWLVLGGSGAAAEEEDE